MVGGKNSSSKWYAIKVSLHTGKGLFFVCLEQQVLVQGKEFQPLKRYRLRLGSPNSEPIRAISLGDLLPFMREYLSKFEDFLPVPASGILSSLFSKENIAPVSNLIRKD